MTCVWCRQSYPVVCRWWCGVGSHLTLRWINLTSGATSTTCAMETKSKSPMWSQICTIMTSPLSCRMEPHHTPPGPHRTSFHVAHVAQQKPRYDYHKKTWGHISVAPSTKRRCSGPVASTETSVSPKTWCATTIESVVEADGGHIPYWRPYCYSVSLIT